MRGGILMTSESLTNEDIKRVLQDTVDSLDKEDTSIKSIVVELHRIIDIIEEDTSSRVSLPQYKCLPIEELKNQINRIENLWVSFIKSNDPDLALEDVDINEDNLYEVIERVNKRKHHYRIFHNIEELSEIRETALLCFWILKLKPFTVLKKDSPIRNSENEYFSMYLILAILQYLTKKLGKEFEKPSDSFIKDAIYIFKYRELSKEAMILFVSSIAQDYGITIDSWV